MSSSFEVSLDSLQSLADRMERVSKHFHRVAEHRYRYSGFGDHDAVEDGLRDFFGNWTDGLDMIHHNLDGVAERLQAAVDAYEDTEDELVKAATPGG